MLKKEVEIITKKAMFVAEDGKEFDNEQACIAHEEELHKKPSVNEMLVAALSTGSRKKKAAYQTELEALGYKIYKADGSWNIDKGRNYIRKYYEESRLITMKRNIPFGRIWKSGYDRKDGSYQTGRYVIVPLEKINLVGILDATPTYRDDTYYNGWRRESSKKVAYMIEAINKRNSAMNKLNNAEAERNRKIEEARKKYEDAVSSANYSYEWTMNEYKKYLDGANATINKLLKKEDK